MQVICSECKRYQNIPPNKLVGKYVICKYCGGTFLWADAKKDLSRKINKNKNVKSN